MTANRYGICELTANVHVPYFADCSTQKKQGKLQKKDATR